MKVLFFYVGRFLAPSVAADLANCQFFPPDPEATLLQDSKYPNLQQKILEDTQISKYIQVPACSAGLGLQIFQIFEYWSSKLYEKKTWDTCVNNTWKQRFVFTGNNRRIDSPDPVHCHTDFAVCTLWRGSKYPNISHNIKLLVKKKLWRILIPAIIDLNFCFWFSPLHFSCCDICQYTIHSYIAYM